MIEFAAGAALGTLAGWVGFRLTGGGGRPPAARRSDVGVHLLPDPALNWLLKAHGALGVWLTELAPNEEGPSAERVVNAERLSVAEITAVDRRLERARDREQGGAERLDAGTLIFRAAGGVAVGLLLPPEGGAAGLAAAELDLERLLEAVRRRPHIVALAQAQAHEAAVESVGSVGLRLAYQLERSLDAEVVVAAVDNELVRVVGVSGQADRRLLDAILPGQSDLARVALGQAQRLRVADDPLAGVVPDRRLRHGASLVIPILVGSDPSPVGAVAVHFGGGGEPSGAALAELEEALRNAGPRLLRGLAGDRALHASKTDPLTRLVNRQGLRDAMGQQGVSAGALVYADLDLFKRLNDTLGHAAGDAALLHVSRLIREQVRGRDTAARIGGEEFAVWLPDASLDLGRQIAERIRVKIGNTPWDWKGRPWPLSASFGVAACPETNRSLENLAAQADAALYVAKTSGRNRVEVAGASTGVRR